MHQLIACPAVSGSSGWRSTATSQHPSLVAEMPPPLAVDIDMQPQRMLPVGVVVAVRMVIGGLA